MNVINSSLIYPFILWQYFKLYTRDSTKRMFSYNIYYHGKYDADLLKSIFTDMCRHLIVR